MNFLMCVFVDIADIARYNIDMNDLIDQSNETDGDVAQGGIKSHALAIGLFVMTLIALPAYLSAMEGQFIDMEFLASLCGIAGWGS